MDPQTQNQNYQPLRLPANINLTQVVAVIVFFIAFFFVLARVDKYLRIKAIDDCQKISRYEVTLQGENAKIWHPLEDIYNKCLIDKGYEVK